MTAAAFGAATHWGTAIGVPGLENYGDDRVSSISCPSPGACSAAGYFRNGPSFLVNEKHGIWEKEINVQYGVWSGIVSISCATAGSCAAGGGYFEGNTYDHAFVVTKRHGLWGKPIDVPGMTQLEHGGGSRVETISCPEPGFCAAGGGSYGGSYHAFLVNERNGVWNNAIRVRGTAASSLVNSISCTDARSCTAGGSNDGLPFVVDETNGGWGRAIEVPGFAALSHGATGGAVTSVSCGEAGYCAAVGDYTDSGGAARAFIVRQRHGAWGKAFEVPGIEALNLGGAPGVRIYSISCPTASSCAAAGSYTDGSDEVQAFVVRTRNGIWLKAIEVPGLAALNAGGHAEAVSISCAKAGYCGAGGYYYGGSTSDPSHDEQAFVVTETSGVWNTAIEVPGSAALNTAGDAGVSAVSCGAALSCVAGGFYVGDFHVTQSS